MYSLKIAFCHSAIKHKLLYNSCFGQSYEQTIYCEFFFKHKTEKKKKITAAAEDQAKVQILSEMDTKSSEVNELAKQYTTALPHASTIQMRFLPCNDPMNLCASTPALR